MKSIHRTIEALKEPLYQPIHSLTISDPWYENDVWCRYENHDIEMDQLQMFITHEVIEDSGIKDDEEYRQVAIDMRNGYMKGERNETKEFSIGVDTAEYTIRTDQGETSIKTGADGIWGVVNEHYYNGQLGQIIIYLVTPEEYVMSEELFIKQVADAFKIHDPEIVQILCEDEELDLTEAVQEADFEMKVS